MENCSIISVLGESKIIAPPDYVDLWFTIKKVSSTMNESQKEVNKMVNNLLKILKNYGVEDIKTNYIDIRQEEDWDEKEKNIGQMVIQSISAKIYDLDKNIGNLKDVIDNFSAENNNFEIMISFKVKDLDKLALEVRELAYKNALDKAIHYAKMANLSISRISKISEFSPNERTNMWYSTLEKRNNKKLADNYQANIPIGNLEFGIKLYCDFIAE